MTWDENLNGANHAETCAGRRFIQGRLRRRRPIPSASVLLRNLRTSAACAGLFPLAPANARCTARSNSLRSVDAIQSSGGRQKAGTLVPAFRIPTAFRDIVFDEKNIGMSELPDNVNAEKVTAENVDGWTSATEPLSDTDSQKLDSMLDDILGDLESLAPKVKLGEKEKTGE